MKQHDLDEVRTVARELEAAATNPAHNPHAQEIEALLLAADPSARPFAEGIKAKLNLQYKGAPTLIKYTDPTPYKKDLRRRMHQVAATVLGDLHILDDEPRVAFYEAVHPEIDLATSLLYDATNFSYGQIRRVVEDLPILARADIIAAGTADRAAIRCHWPTIRSRRVDIRHAHGLRRVPRPATPPYVYAAQPTAYQPARLRGTTRINGHGAGRRLGYLRDHHPKSRGLYRAMETDLPYEASYVLPMATRKRTLFIMNPRELTHMVELHSSLVATCHTAKWCGICWSRSVPCTRTWCSTSA